MPRILVLSRYTRLGASSRLRTYQFRPWLEDCGYEIEYMPLLMITILMVYIVRKKQLSAFKISIHRLKALRKIKKPNLIWLEYEVFPWVPWLFEKQALPQGVPVICDYDDAIFHGMTPIKPLIRFFSPKIDRVMGYSTVTIVGNSYLRQRAIEAGSKEIEIIPTVVDIDRYTVKTFESFNETKNIGWIGTPITWTTYGEDKYDNLKKFLAKKGQHFKRLVQSLTTKKRYIRN